MALAISLIVTVLEILNGFINTDPEKIKMARTFNANRFQLLTKVVIPANISTFINSLKVNIGLSLVGVISGEFLVSKAGLRILNSIWRASISTWLSNGKCCNTGSSCSGYVWSGSPTRKNNFKNKEIWIKRKPNFKYNLANFNRNHNRC